MIAISPDWQELKEGGHESFAQAWAAAARSAGHRVRLVNLLKPDLVERVADCDGLMCRFTYTHQARMISQRILPAIEHGLGIPVFPSWRSAWHFEDKLTQFYLLSAAGIPMPRTWIFWSKESALRFIESATYPFVTKLSPGFKSRNVRLVTNREQARSYVEMLFGKGIASFDEEFDSAPTAFTLTGTQAGYFYAQEFVAGNDHDTRVAIIGERGFAFRRFNRPNDFRASGSGLIDRDPSTIDQEAIQFGFNVARRLNMECVAMDVLRHDGRLVVTEVSYTFEAWKLLACPGHWVRRDGSTALDWKSGAYSPELAIFEDFVRAMSAARAARRAS